MAAVLSPARQCKLAFAACPAAASGLGQAGRIGPQSVVWATVPDGRNVLACRNALARIADAESRAIRQRWWRATRLLPSAALCAAGNGARGQHGAHRAASLTGCATLNARATVRCAASTRTLRVSPTPTCPNPRRPAIARTPISAAAMAKERWPPAPRRLPRTRPRPLTRLAAARRILQSGLGRNGPSGACPAALTASARDTLPAFRAQTQTVARCVRAARGRQRQRQRQ